MYLVLYDVDTTTAKGRTRLRKVAKICCNYGQRVQNSVFECMLTGAQYAKLKAELLSVIDDEKDSLRIYSLGKKYNSDSIEHFGTKESYNPQGTLLI